MIAGLKPYPKYKESSQAWLGDVPRHWSMVPNRALFAEVKDRDRPDEELLSVTITRGIVRQKTLLESSSKKDSSNLDKSAYKLVQPYDIAYNKMRAWQGAIGASALRGIISPAYVVMRLRNADDLPSYFHNLYRTPQFAKEAERWSYGITSDMWSLRPEHFKMIYSPVPPVDEQSAIVRFLDHADRKIRRYIRAKQKLMKLLEEQKQAVIHRAVTRGLDPSAPFKSSGVPWLGDIPKHWEVLPVKRCSSVISKGTTPSTEGREILETGQIRFLKAENISNGMIVSKPSFFIDDETHILLRRSELHQDDVLFVIAGATLGKTAIIRGEHVPANTNQAVAFIRHNHRVVAEFLALWLKSPRIKEQVWLNAVQSAQPNLSMASLGMFSMPIPTRSEQVAIVKDVESDTSRFDATISRLERGVELLHEYRTRLIADVVTGKLDVREAAAKIPDDVPEPEPAEEIEPPAEGTDAEEPVPEEIEA